MSTPELAVMPATEPTTRPLSYAEAVNAALTRCLEQVPETLLYGEDVGKAGGIFGVTKGLQKRFGDRVFDTPISESAILGSAVGAAMMGLRPIVEIMWIDFSLVALDQVINQLANVRYINRGRLSAPVVIRTQQGAAPGACAQHVQNLEALFLHIPGLRVCMPWSVQDAYDLLVSSVYCEDPVLLIENRTLYRERQQIVLGRPPAPIGGSRTHRAGTDVTIVTWGAMTAAVLAAADELAAEGVQAEVIETVWLNPFDTDAVVASAARTRRLVVVHEANVTGGYGAEVLARVAEAGVALDSPARRIGVPDARMPSAPTLATALLPSPASIAAGVRDVLGR